MVNNLMGRQAGSQGSTTLTDGTLVQMPLLTYRAKTFAAFFTISAAKARALLPSNELQPVRVSPRRALVTVQVMEYLEKSIEPYREFVFSIPVHRSRRRDIPLASVALWQRLPGDGSYITHIAVDNKLFHIPYQSEASGAMLWGSQSARLHLGSHPAADELRDLDISPAPLFALDVPQYTLVSNRPDAMTDVGAWRDPRGAYRSLRDRKPTASSTGA